MTLFVDTSVWSLAFRRDKPSTAPEVRALRRTLEGGEVIVTTGLILQELLQGFAGPRASAEIIDRFTALPLLSPNRQGTDNVSRQAHGAGAPEALEAMRAKPSYSAQSSACSSRVSGFHIRRGSSRMSPP